MEHPVVLAVSVLVVLAGTPTAVTAQSETVTVTVTVVDDSGDPVSDVTLVASWAGGRTTATTGAAGTAFLDVPDGADVTIRVEDDRYARNQPYVLEDASEREVELGVAREGSATVRVVNTTGSPIQGAVVSFRRGGETAVNGWTNEDGVLVVPDIERGEYDLVVLSDRFDQNRTTVSVTPRANLTVMVEQATVPATVTVRDDHFDPPRGVADARVMVAGLGMVRTDESGQATVRVPVGARYEVTVTKENYTGTTLALEVGESPVERTVSIRREPGISIEFPGPSCGSTVVARVTDAYGQPVEGAEVQSGREVQTEGDVNTTDATGRARVVAPSGAAGLVIARFEGLRAQAVPPDVECESTPSSTPAATTTGAAAAAADSTATSASAGTPTAASGGTDTSGPGFTPLGALAAVVALALLVRRRR